MIPCGNIGAVYSFPGVSLRSTTRLNADDALSGNMPTQRCGRLPGERWR